MTDGISPTRIEWCIAARMHPTGAQFEGEGRSPVDPVLEVMGYGASLRGCTLPTERLGTLTSTIPSISMPNYRRFYRPGGSYFFTHVTYQRYPWLCTDIGRHALREAIVAVRRKHPFAIDAFVLLPDHFHCILTLPEEDADFPKRWRLTKLMVTKTAKEELALPLEKGRSGELRREGNLWQRRYIDHCLRDERDFANHVEYIHNNPVKHGLVARPTDWAFSSIHRYLK